MGPVPWSNAGPAAAEVCGRLKLLSGHRASADALGVSPSSLATSVGCVVLLCTRMGTSASPGAANLPTWLIAQLPVPLPTALAAPR